MKRERMIRELIVEYLCEKPLARVAFILQYIGDNIDGLTSEERAWAREEALLRGARE